MIEKQFVKWPQNQSMNQTRKGTTATVLSYKATKPCKMIQIMQINTSTLYFMLFTV